MAKDGLGVGSILWLVTDKPLKHVFKGSGSLYLAVYLPVLTFIIEHQLFIVRVLWSGGTEWLEIHFQEE